MQKRNFKAWLKYIEEIHPQTIELGLARVKAVAERLNVLDLGCAVITVAGTNGKGSTVAGLEAIYQAAGFRVGAFTSPYLFRHNEEVRIDGVEASDEMFCDAFEKVEAAREDIQLTFFEFNTLAALIIFKAAQLDVCILEVGLGGRLDAVNIVDTDVAVITSIDIDHAEWLGNTREEIAREKAGIFRSGKPAVCGDFFPPRSIGIYAEELGVKVFYQNVDFRFWLEGLEAWGWECGSLSYGDLPVPSLALQNMATVLMVVELLRSELVVDKSAVIEGLRGVNLTGRIEIRPGVVTEIFDVSHNPGAARFLVEKLKGMPVAGRTLAVFSMLGDKDIRGTVEIMDEVVDEWFVGELGVKRGAGIRDLEKVFRELGIGGVWSFDDVGVAYQSAGKLAKAGDRILVFGSFYTVSAVLSS